MMNDAPDDTRRWRCHPPRVPAKPTSADRLGSAVHL